MSDLVYRIRGDDSLSHAYQSKYMKSTYKADVSAPSFSKTTKGIVGRKRGGNYEYGSYASPYYDPVARHERYMKEKAAGKFGPASSIGSTSKGRSGGSGKGKSGKGGKSGKAGKGNKAALSNAIKKLQEESELNTAAQQEATKRKIADLKDRLLEKIELLNKGGELEEGHNTAEIRGTIQSLKEQIRTEGTNLSGWISQEKTALARRIAKLQGKKYDEGAEERKKQQQEAKDKKVKQRADAIYKRKTGN